MTNVKMEGLDDFKSKMAAVTGGMLYRYGRSSLRKSAKIVLNAAKSNASRINDPKTPEDISKNIVMRWSKKRFSASQDLSFRIGVLGGARPTTSSKSKRRRFNERQSLEALGELSGKGKGNPGGDTWYWRLVEFGTQSSRAQPFLRPALSSNLEKVQYRFSVEINKGISIALKRAERGRQ